MKLYQNIVVLIVIFAFCGDVGNLINSVWTGQEMRSQNSGLLLPGAHAIWGHVAKLVAKTLVRSVSRTGKKITKNKRPRIKGTHEDEQSRKQKDQDRANENTCEPGWLKYKGSCYFFSKNSNTWINAERECRQKSSNLVKIESASENIWIKRQAEVTHDQRWIGAREVHGQWEWVSDLSPLTFTSWAVNEPNNAKENCAHIHKVISYNWNDIKCSKRFNFICEKSTVSLKERIK
ncbi:unnamed protein product [Mytilus edulis]|uniref:C-type lectin domain-containing protein n=1 Tax=Mytilus edulis TaxID=6550 RepID=A0A8S3RHR3_MYTED|nr:unnamed protein product [Mytilus edulis]